MIWIILAILAVGYFIVKAIQRQTQVNALIAQQQLQQKEIDKIEVQEAAQRQLESSPEYRKQEQATRDYFHHLGDILECQVRIAERKIKLLEPPQQLVVWQDYKTGKLLSKNIVLTDKVAIKKALKYDIESDEELIKGLTKDYEKKKKQYAGFEPEDLEFAKSKYGLDEAFSGEDWIEEEGSWGMYKKKEQELNALNKKLRELQSKTKVQPKARLVA